MNSAASINDWPEAFLPARHYCDPAIRAWEVEQDLPDHWHPVLADDALPPGHAIAIQWQDRPILLSRPRQGDPLAFANICPHRGVALQEPTSGAVPCRRWICPYHGWTYATSGQLLAAAREREFLSPFDRREWPLRSLPCRSLAGLIWIRPGPSGSAGGSGRTGPALEEQLDLVLSEAADLLAQPRVSLAAGSQELAADWKIAHDNTLDDYHVAIAHPTTLHRVQGPVRAYRHSFGQSCNLLATPLPGATGVTPAHFLTFGVPPCHHLLFWPDGRLASISFLPLSPGRCRMDLKLLGPEALRPSADAWLAEMDCFLAEDRTLVESAARGYGGGLRPGPPHSLERRVLHHQGLYRKRLLDPITGCPGLRRAPPEECPDTPPHGREPAGHPDRRG